MMNSTQQSMRRSRASLPKEMLCSVSPGAVRISLIIFCTVALGRERSSAPGWHLVFSSYIETSSMVVVVVGSKMTYHRTLGRTWWVVG